MTDLPVTAAQLAKLEADLRAAIAEKDSATIKELRTELAELRKEMEKRAKRKGPKRAAPPPPPPPADDEEDAEEEEEEEEEEDDPWA